MQDRAHETPLCPEGDFRFWTGVGAASLAAYVLGCLAGLPGVVAQGADGVGTIDRLSAAGAATVWLLLCTGALSAGFAAVSLVRGRPPGSAADIASRAFACAAVASLCRYVPIGVPLLKAAFDAVATATASAFLVRSAFRVHTRDAFAAVAVGSGALGALAAAAFVVTWAVRAGY